MNTVNSDCERRNLCLVPLLSVKFCELNQFVVIVTMVVL